MRQPHSFINMKIVRYDINVPDEVLRILDTLNSAGYEAYIVGGCVRDALLGRNPNDWDITSSALPEQVKKLFPHTVDTGIQHGTVMVISNGTGFEVTTYRIDGVYKDSRHPENVTFTRSLEEDLKRRDFTINAFAWDKNGIVDLFGGLDDLKNGLIRCVGDPGQRFSEDALRIMRAVRFSAQLGFDIEEKTRERISDFADRLGNISMERIRVEWEKTLISPNPEYVNKYAALGLAPFIVRDFHDRCFDPDNADLLREIMRRYYQTAGDDKREMFRRIAMAAFFENLTPEEAGKVFRVMKYDNKTRNAVTGILGNMNETIYPDRILVKQLLNRLGTELCESILEFRKIKDHVSGSAEDEKNMDLTARMIQDISASREPWNIKQLAVNGTDLMAAGIPGGKKIGDFLEKILQKVIQSPTLNTKEILCDKTFLLEVENECKG